MDFHRYPKDYDVIVIGAGHAGCEASLAPARMGLKTLTLTVSLDHVAFMPCNPSLGGPGKSHIIREIDALGGEMAKNMDETMIQIRMLNTSKGPAVHGLRGQSNKDEYHKRMKQVLEQEDNIDLKQQIAEEIIVEDGIVKGVVTKTGVFFPAKKVILTTGTFLKGRIIIGEAEFNAGPNQQYPANKLSDSLSELGINLRRFKTGTPPRVSGKSMDFSKMEPQPGEEGLSFSFESEGLTGDQVMCYLTYTTEETHKIISDNKMRTPLFSGVIDGVGPRYCPSIEDKVMRFPDKDRHQLFVEPEGLDTDEYYISGFATSLPYDVQIEMARTIIGLEDVEIMRPGYAIEYDCVDPEELKLDLELKKVKGLYTAGQINGSSGYEEAAGQGLMAGINAARSLQEKDPIILKRSQAYIGVLIDDLVTKGTPEPYRIMTSRAEYRLLLRQDNADQRLTPLGREIGLVEEKRYKNYQEKIKSVKKVISFLRSDENQVNPTKEVRAKLEELESGNLSKPVSLEKLLRRPEISYTDLDFFVKDLPEITKEVQEQVEIQVKYKGYIDRQEAQVKQFRAMEEKKIPADLDYKKLDNLRLEAREKLNKIKPFSIGQASRISGVSPADISALMIYLEQYNRSKKKSKRMLKMEITKEEFLEKLKFGIKELNIPYSNEQLNQLWDYYVFFIQENKKYNLSSITEPEAVIKKHFLDSLVILNQLDFKKRKRCLDIGTGAGFPGMVLKLFLPGDTFNLLDSSAKKVNFLNQLIYKLKLTGIDATHGRAEDLAQLKDWRGSFDYVYSRAVASLDVLLEYTVPFLKVGALAYLYKGPEYKNEIKKANNALNILGAEIKETIKVDVPGLKAERYLIIIEKTKLTDKKYPRRAGIPKKRPL